jgi:hypothetical protein
MGSVTAAKKKAIVHDLVNDLRDTIAKHQLDDAAVSLAVGQLNVIREYDEERFPPLIPRYDYAYEKNDAPRTLAEALLWKLGKWTVYQGFAAKYKDPESKPDKDVVFYAFIRHMRDPSEPIYDQHAIRALWAVDPDIKSSDTAKLKSLLFDGECEWKDTAGGDNAIECYELYVSRVKEICAYRGVNLQGLDRLLMPLGQAIKRATKTYADFEALRK